MTRFVAPICYGCTHLQTILNGDSEKWSCDAFELIPDAILQSNYDHRQQYPGDNGIQFEAKDKESQTYVERLFDE